MTIADTDVLVDYLRGRGEAERISLRKQSFCTTVITAFELWAGANGPKQSSKRSLPQSECLVWILRERDGLARFEDSLTVGASQSGWQIP
jgi:predicted nucleic acid-binding protein